MIERGHIINLLKKAKKAARRGRGSELKALSEQTVHSATIHQDEDNTLAAVVIYTLGKIVWKGERYYKEDYASYLDFYLKAVDKMIYFLKKEDDDAFNQEVKQMVSSKEVSAEFRQHLKSLFRKAMINKAAKMYEHGVSMQKTAKLLDISLWELAEYSGQTGVADMNYGKTIDVKKRIANAMEIFG